MIDLEGANSNQYQYIVMVTCMVVPQDMPIYDLLVINAKLVTLVPVLQRIRVRVQTGLTEYLTALPGLLIYLKFKTPHTRFLVYEA